MVCGIDGGLNGGIVFLEAGKLRFKSPMPVIKVDGKSKYDLDKIKSLLIQHQPNMTYLESAQAMPGQGTVSMFRIGLNYGIMQGLLTGLGLQYILVNPRKWQNWVFATFNLDKKDTKDCGFQVCKKLFPDESWLKTSRCKTFHDGMTDAACIAYYGSFSAKG